MANYSHGLGKTDFSSLPLFLCPLSLMFPPLSVGISSYLFCYNLLLIFASGSL